MKVILLKHVPELGDEGDVKEIALGYARNFLIPQGLVKEATPEALAELEARKQKMAKEAELDLAKTEQLAAKLEGQKVEVTAKASEEGTLYAAISPAKIASALKEKGLEVRKEQIRAEHIKELGEYEVVVELDHGLEARITLIINSE
ncbi:MAG: 50S ribosomal protein L9 [Candidatus Buchananbacteria bacterium RIFCSPHIGHO2_02_FULL_38_8]|uniref:Large ribosomal subunit protein bL9 n=2 Tax=Candidatus Buchananiibacteriota TaxID=1817903 RepID=A0A1G1XT58_9BACT|nr:MAG: 50S ribosomal protein L9 [Candidatus Buchananbacteria bacterium RIFCSPHIGHO2_01_FULL_39_8]OGY47239.1 MAG: 50S ribosomal protein L9 [Candidatus Buchananbacteria bacterium RIFCSPHIGHO2_02_FULL_38_8]